MLDAIIYGIAQGVLEWIPVSSEGIYALLRTRSADGLSIALIIRESLFLHLGTFLAATIYFHKDIAAFFKTLFSYGTASAEDKKVFGFLLVSTALSGLLGFTLLHVLSSLEDTGAFPGKTITFAIGVLLLITAGLQIRSKSQGDKNIKNIKDLRWKDGVILGVVQGLAVLPGLSRSGLTISTLLLKKFDKAICLRLSFLMSLPIVLAGNILLNLDESFLSPESLVGLFCSFLFGLLTLRALFKLVEKIHFGYFVLCLALVTIASALIR